MASNYVNCIMQDRYGLFYVGMYGAFQTYDGQRFHDVKTFDLNGHAQPHYITCLLERQNGDILVGTSAHGLLRMTNKQEAHQIGGALKDLNTIHRMIEDHRQRIWMATDGQGLICYDGKNVKRYFQEPHFLNTVLDVCEDKQGRIYVATTNAGLFRLDGETPVHIEGTGNKHISTLYYNRRNHIMLGCDGNGLAIYDPQSGRVVDNPTTAGMWT